MKERLDVLLVEKKITASRKIAQSLILSGKVLVDDTPVTKAGTKVSIESELRVKGEIHPYVSRGGLKLKGAVEAFKINMNGQSALDVGASTGGFTDVMLREGIDKVVAIDVGHNQMAWSIRNHPSVFLHEGVNARLLKFDDLGECFDVITIDVSFISLKLVIPALLQFSTSETDWLALIKPQFEAGPDRVGKGGIVTDTEVQNSVVDELVEFGKRHGLVQQGLIKSPIKGTQGNQEFFIHWKQA